MRVYQAEMRLIQISSLLTILVIGVVFVLNAYGHQPTTTDPDPYNTTSIVQEDTSPYIICLGDSYTYGYPERNLESDPSWPHHLGEILNVKVANEGKQKQTSKDLLERFDSDIIEKNTTNPAIIIIFAGMGDALSEEPVSVVTFERYINNLVEKAQDHGIKPVLIMPFSYPEADKQQYISEYRAWLSEFSEANTIMLVDFQGFLCDEDNGIKKQYTSTAGKYPNAEGYLEMGRYIADQLKDEI
ncbi:MAG: GDSL-type esterase/lipase family protein [Peptococcaceae bacterium]|nr:GDSL-type esterase/lipase family protein [Peptococcaceae bacterium]